MISEGSPPVLLRSCWALRGGDARGRDARESSWLPLVSSPRWLEGSPNLLGSSADAPRVVPLPMPAVDTPVAKLEGAPLESPPTWLVLAKEARDERRLGLARSTSCPRVAAMLPGGSMLTAACSSPPVPPAPPPPSTDSSRTCRCTCDT